MENILIVKGDPASATGGKLNSMALDYMAYPLVGSDDPSIIENTLTRMWRLESNRFSHQYAYEAKLGQETVGMITCYPVKTMNKLALPTFQQFVKLRKWDLISYCLSHVEDLWSMASLEEGRDDEFHIGTIATLPETRGYGIGSKLIHFAEEQAKLHQFQKCSLTVKKENKSALSLYERLGYQIANFIEKEPYSLFRMVKSLPAPVLA